MLYKKKMNVFYTTNNKMGNKMKSWQQAIDNLPTDENGEPECTESESALIIFKHLST